MELAYKAFAEIEGTSELRVFGRKFRKPVGFRMFLRNSTQFCIYCDVAKRTAERENRNYCEFGGASQKGKLLADFFGAF